MSTPPEWLSTLLTCGSTESTAISTAHAPSAPQAVCVPLETNHTVVIRAENVIGPEGPPGNDSFGASPTERIDCGR